LPGDSLLKEVFTLSEKLGKVAFSEIVKVSSGRVIIPIDLNDEKDKRLIDVFNETLKKFLKTSSSTRSRFQGNRVNEVGRRIEELLVNELNKPPLSVKKLSKTGYPDIEVTHEGRTIYLEMKTSSVVEDSSFRYFYYTSGKKITTDAKHLLLDITVSEENAHYWKIEKWALSDLSKLQVKLKAEFNATKADLLDKNARIISS
jgi:hypothetical protein